jgi:hypothetical protein
MAKPVDKENMTPGGDETCGAKSLGSLERISSSGNSITPLICFAARFGAEADAGADTGAACIGAGAGGAGAKATGFRAGGVTGARAGFTATGAAVTGRLSGFENHFLITANMGRALPGISGMIFKQLK